MIKLTKDQWFGRLTSEAEDALINISNGCPTSMVKYFKDHRDNILWAICSDDTINICFKEIPPKLKLYLEAKEKKYLYEELEEMEENAELVSDETDWFEISGGHIVVSFWFD